MSEKETTNNLIYAYALGCLDESDIKKIKEGGKVDPNFSWEELGEFQNLISLMSSILVVEIPKPEVKERVAKKLYNLKKEELQPVHQNENSSLKESIISEHEFDNVENEIEEDAGFKNDEEILNENENKYDNYNLTEENKFSENNLEDEISTVENNTLENLNKFEDESAVHFEDQNKSEMIEEKFEDSIEDQTFKEFGIEEGNENFEIDDDFLPKRKEPEKFRFEDNDDDEPENKETQKFIDKFIEHNKSSITEKIDKTIGGNEKSIDDPEKNILKVGEIEYELVPPPSRNFPIFKSLLSDEEKDVLLENTIEDQGDTDSLKSQSLQRVFIQKETGSKLPIILLSIFSVIFLTAAVYIYFNFKNIIGAYEKEIADLKTDSATLYSSRQTSNAVISFLESPDVAAVELGPTDADPNSSGKLYINFEEGTGYLFTKNLPVLTNDNLLQLWLSNSGKFISLGVVDSKGNEEYYPFNFDPISRVKNTEVLVTEESSEGAKQPSSKLLLIGALE